MLILSGSISDLIGGAAVKVAFIFAFVWCIHWMFGKKEEPDEDEGD